MKSECLPQPHIIAYIDILGTKDRLFLGDENEISKSMKRIYDAINTTLSQISNENLIPGEYKVRIFSDNIVITTSCTADMVESTRRAAALIAIVGMFQFGMAMRGWLVRGGICRGSLYMDNNFLIGLGLVEAYQMEDEVAQFPRIIVSNTLYSEIEKSKNQETLNTNLVIPDCNEDQRYFIDYLYYANRKEFLSDYSERKDDLYTHLNTINAYLSLSSKTTETEKRTRMINKLNWVARYHNQYCRRVKEDVQQFDVDSHLFQLNYLEQNKDHAAMNNNKLSLFSESKIYMEERKQKHENNE